MREFVIRALRNYGYRFLGFRSGSYIFCKPLGYGILSAEMREGENSVSVMLMVKGHMKDGKRPNLLWQETTGTFPKNMTNRRCTRLLCKPLPTVRQTSSLKRLWLGCKTET